MKAAGGYDGLAQRRRGADSPVEGGMKGKGGFDRGRQARTGRFPEKIVDIPARFVL